MSMNKFMHPRNIYRSPPNFTQLALDFEEFRNAGKLNIQGKFCVNFKDANALRSLTKCLLKRDFALNVHLPEGKLVPTLPLRLNYILWLEDMVKQSGIIQPATGVDIGCGASCVYPLLATRTNDWTMFGLESNADSVRYARENITQNGLDHRITIIQQESESTKIFEALLQAHPGRSIAFCMCNPPFFGSLDELQPPTNLLGKRNRSGKRRPAKCPQTGTTDELFVNGGEIEFVRRIIEESCVLQKRILIYTTMLGHKANVAKVLQILRDLGVWNICTTEFCQGHTTRWGVGWSFDDTIALKNTPKYGPSSVKTMSESKSYSFIISRELENTVIDLKIQLDSILESIGITITDWNAISNTRWTGKVVTDKNTWSNQRRRRREIERNDALKNGLKEDIVPENSSIGDEPFLIAMLTIWRKQISRNTDSQHLQSILDVEYVTGTGTRDAANQLMNFIQNQWK